MLTMFRQKYIAIIAYISIFYLPGDFLFEPSSPWSKMSTYTCSFNASMISILQCNLWKELDGGSPSSMRSRHLISSTKCVPRVKCGDLLAAKQTVLCNHLRKHAKRSDKQRVLMHRHQRWNVRHGLCHIYMRYLYIYELFIAFVCFVVCSLL